MPAAMRSCNRLGAIITAIPRTGSIETRRNGKLGLGNAMPASCATSRRDSPKARMTREPSGIRLVPNLDRMPRTSAGGGTAAAAMSLA